MPLSMSILVYIRYSLTFKCSITLWLYFTWQILHIYARYACAHLFCSVLLKFLFVWIDVKINYNHCCFWCFCSSSLLYRQTSGFFKKRSLGDNGSKGRISFMLPIQQDQNMTHTHTQPFNGPLSGTTRVGRYLKKHSPTHTHPDHQTSFINFFHLLRSVTSSLFNFRAWQPSSTTCVQVLFGLPLG